MKIYHGGYITVEAPRILKSRFPKDFGEGFYCTELEEQAERWASRYDTAVVSNYEYSSNAKYAIPTHWDIGKVYKRLIIDVSRHNEKPNPTHWGG